MHTRFKPALFFLFAASLLVQGCSLTSHPLGPAAPGKASSSAEMEKLLDQPGPVQLDSINSADWAVPLSGLLNLASPAAKAAGLKERDEAIQVYAHWLHHPQHGDFLVDTGVSRKMLDPADPASPSWLLRQGMHLEKMQLRTSTAELLHGKKLAGVFFTHLHIDHISGMPDIPASVPLYTGKSEATERNFLNAFVQGTSDRLLQGKQPLQEWNFQPDPQQRFEGIVDIFADGSVFAISVPGHTPGSVAYLVRSTHGPVLLTGDTCHTRWGWEHTVEPGDFTQDQRRNLDNLKRLKELVTRHPQIEVRLGHQR